ncbi:hypothetical protein [Erysipelothrix aquatica]|uniref:hypothetical protein n=1 Tax=Erysipelothrix aquatica TaxID=2683714 RepID=UPI00135AAC85|nr:hypothetical protein [Erysipelothrix aquatica]
MNFNKSIKLKILMWANQFITSILFICIIEVIMSSFGDHCYHQSKCTPPQVCTVQSYIMEQGFIMINVIALVITGVIALNLVIKYWIYYHADITKVLRLVGYSTLDQVKYHCVALRRITVSAYLVSTLVIRFHYGSLKINILVALFLSFLIIHILTYIKVLFCVRKEYIDVTVGINKYRNRCIKVLEGVMSIIQIAVPLTFSMFLVINMQNAYTDFQMQQTFSKSKSLTHFDPIENDALSESFEGRIGKLNDTQLNQYKTRIERLLNQYEEQLVLLFEQVYQEKFNLRVSIEKYRSISKLVGEFNNLEVVAGRGLIEKDYEFEDGSIPVLVGYNLRKNISINQTFEKDTMQFVVVGIMKQHQTITSPQYFLPESIDNDIVIPFHPKHIQTMNFEINHHILKNIIINDLSDNQIKEVLQTLNLSPISFKTIDGQKELAESLKSKLSYAMIWVYIGLFTMFYALLCYFISIFLDLEISKYKYAVMQTVGYSKTQITIHLIMNKLIQLMMGLFLAQFITTGMGAATKIGILTNSILALTIIVGIWYLAWRKIENLEITKVIAGKR